MLLTDLIQNCGIYVYDNKLLFTYNFKDGTKTITLTEVEAALCSGFNLSSSTNPETSVSGFFFVC